MDNVFDTVTVTNIITSGSAFAVKHKTGESCFVPASIMYTANLKAGDTVEALLIRNPNEMVVHRTPYMVRFVKSPAPTIADVAPPIVAPVAPVAPKPAFDPAEVEAFVRQRMKGGGVWTVATMFEEYMGNPQATRMDNLPAYNAVSYSLRKMFDNDECAKWSMWTKASQAKVGREWFSCYPNRVDVDEWAEE
jgi:hypothetical protein